MARPGVAAERIVEIIRELEAQGQEATVTTVRERLGTGSFSTIGAVLSDWRQRKAGEVRPSVPEAPELVRLLSHRVWEEAWSGAMKAHEPERQAFARERQESERAKAEMLAEIARLEAELEAERNALAQATQAHAAERDGLREDVQSVRASLAVAEAALAEARSRVEQEEGQNAKLSERLLAETARTEAQAARFAAEIARLEGERDSEREQAVRSAEAFTLERDTLRDEIAQVRGKVAAAEGALNEARKQVEHEQGRNRELSERVISEAATAQALAARVEELEKRAR